MEFFPPTVPASCVLKTAPLAAKVTVSFALLVPWVKSSAMVSVMCQIIAALPAVLHAPVVLLRVILQLAPSACQDGSSMTEGVILVKLAALFAPITTLTSVCNVYQDTT